MALASCAILILKLMKKPQQSGHDYGGMPDSTKVQVVGGRLKGPQRINYSLGYK
jgi:hypothetical protein